MMRRFCGLSVFLFFLLITGFSFNCAVAQASGSEHINDVLDAEFEWLQEEAKATVTIATKTKMAVKDAPSIVTVITAEEIQNMGARNIVDVLKTILGFDIFYANDPNGRLNIRGMLAFISNKRSIKLMIDGHVLQWSVNDYHFSKLPLAGIKKIEIIRGPGSALYGTEAFMGVINIITHKGGETPSRASLEYGSFDTVKPSAEFSYKKDDFSAYLYADYYETSGYEAQIESDASANYPEDSLFVGSESRDMTNDSQHHTFRTRLDYKNLYFSGFLQKVETKMPVGMLNFLTDDDDLRSLYAYGEIGYNLPIADRGNLLARGYCDYIDKKLLYEDFPEETSAKHIGFGSDEGLHVGPFGKYEVFGLEVSGDYDILPGINVAAGLSREKHEHYDFAENANFNFSGQTIVIDGKEYLPFPFYPAERFAGGLTNTAMFVKTGYEEAKADVIGMYGQGTLDLRELFSWENALENLSFTAGIRYDHYRNKGVERGVTEFSSANPRFGLVIAPIERLWFKLLYGEAFRAPSLSELYLLDNAFMAENKDLEPEKLTTWEGLVGFRFSENISATLTGFHIKAKDIIWLYMSLDEKMRYDNIGAMESIGAEFELKAKFGRQRYAYLNFTV